MCLTLLLSFVLTSVSPTWEVYPSYDLVLDAYKIGDTLYLATTGGVAAWSLPLDSIVKTWTTVNGIPVIPIFSLASTQSEEGTILWGADPGYGLVYKTEDTDSFCPYPQEVLHFDRARETQVLLAFGDSLFLGTRNGIFVLDTKGTASPEDDKVTYSEPGSEGPSGIIYDIEFFRDSLYVGSEDGLYVASLSDFTNWRHIGVEDGLPSSFVYKVQMGTDYLAIGTDEGLFFLRGDSVISVIDGASVRDLDFYGDTLFVACLEINNNWRGGVYEVLPDGTTMSLGRCTNFSQMWKLWSVNAWWVRRGEDGRIWASFGWRGRSLGTPGGTGIYKKDQNSWDLLRFGVLPFSNVDALVSSADGVLWASCYLFNPYPAPFVGIKPDGELVYPYGFYPKDTTSQNVVRNVSSIAVTKEGDLWIGTLWSGMIHKFSSSGKYLRTIYANSNWVKDVMIDSEGRLVAALINYGIDRCNPEEDSVHWEHLYDSGGLFNPFTIKENIDGSLWIGTGTGILIIEKDGRTRMITEDDGLPEPPVRSIYFDNSGAWVGTANGLAHLSGEHIDKVYLRGEVILGAVKTGNRIWALSYDKLTLIDENGNVTYFRPSTSPLTSYLTRSDTTHYHPMAVDSSGNVWVGTDAGLNKIYLQGGYVSSDTLFIYPNPVNLNETKSLYILNVPKESEISIFTVSGEKISPSLYELNFSGSGMATLTFSEDEKLSPGIYLISIYKGKKRHILKFAILK